MPPGLTPRRIGYRPTQVGARLPRLSPVCGAFTRPPLRPQAPQSQDDRWAPSEQSAEKGRKSRSSIKQKYGSRATRSLQERHRLLCVACACFTPEAGGKRCRVPRPTRCPRTPPALPARGSDEKETGQIAAQRQGKEEAIWEERSDHRKGHIAQPSREELVRHGQHAWTSGRHSECKKPISKGPLLFDSLHMTFLR